MNDSISHIYSLIEKVSRNTRTGQMSCAQTYKIPSRSPFDSLQNSFGSHYSNGEVKREVLSSVLRSDEPSLLPIPLFECLLHTSPLCFGCCVKVEGHDSWGLLFTSQHNEERSQSFIREGSR